MEINDNEINQSNKANLAVADAMMVVQSKMLKDVIENPRLYGVEPGGNQKQSTPAVNIYEENLIRASEGRCEAASATAAEYLYTKHGELFDTIMAIKSFAHTQQLKNAYGFHVYFLAQDKENCRYAGSPANHTDQSGSPMTKIFKSKNLGEILDKIEEKDGGEWPTKETIVSEIEKNYFPASEIKMRAGNMNSQIKIPYISIFTASNILSGEFEMDIL